MNRKRKNKNVVAAAPKNKKTSNDLLSLLASVCLTLEPNCKNDRIEKENELMVCAVCGSENINEERLTSVRVNCQTKIDEYHMGYSCEACSDVVEIITEKEYLEQGKKSSTA